MMKKLITLLSIITLCFSNINAQVVNVFTEANAANATNDANTIGSATGTRVDITSEPNGDGTYKIRATANTTSTGKLYLNIPASSSEAHLLKFTASESSGADGRLSYIRNNDDSTVNIKSVPFGTTSNEYSLVLNDLDGTDFTLQFELYYVSIGDYIEIDNISITPINEQNLGLGDNIFVEANAASLDNDSNTIGSVTGVNTDITSESNGDGTYKIRATTNSTDNGELTFYFPASTTEPHLIKFTATESVGADVRLVVGRNSNNTAYSLQYLYLNDNNPKEYIASLDGLDGTDFRLTFYLYYSEIGDYVEIDDISIIPITSFTPPISSDTQAPTAPILSSNAKTDTTVDLSWTTSIAPNTYINDYKVYMNGSYLSALSGGTRNYQVTGLTPSTSYEFTVIATEQSTHNQSPFSNTVSVTTNDSSGGFTVTDQAEVTAFEAIHGTLTTSQKEAHNYLVSYLKYHGIWNLLDDVSTCLDNNYYKLKNSSTKNNLQGGDTGVNLDQYTYNDISLTVDYNDDVTTSNILLGNNNSSFRFLLQNGYKAFHCGSKVLKPPYNITMNTKQTIVLTSNSNELSFVTKSGYLRKIDNSGNTGSIASGNLIINDTNSDLKLNFFALGKGLSIEQSKLLAEGIKEFNSLLSRTDFDVEVDSYEFIGNSITNGFIPPSTITSNNFPQLIANSMGFTNTSVNSSKQAQDGLRLDEALTELQTYDQYGLLNRNPNVNTYLIVSLGTNDFLQGATAETVKTNLDTYTGLLTAAGNKVFVILPHRETSYTGDDPNNYNTQVPDFINRVESDSRYSDGTLAYGNMVFETGNATQDDTSNTTYWYDGLHPNDAFYTAIAPIIEDGIKQNITNPTTDLYSISYSSSSNSTGEVLENGVTITESNAANFNVEVVNPSSSVSSVEFILSGSENYAIIENNAPFNLYGDNSSTSLPIGNYTLTVNPRNSIGETIPNASTIVNFQVISDTNNPNTGTGGGYWSKNNQDVYYNDGKVGIGTDTPDEKLAVNGTIHSREVRVDLENWPDYVFAKDYNLPTLTYLQNYIEEKGHLPNIPSAKEVEENGLSLGEIIKIQQEKIEELTLYIINQENRLEKLEEIIKKQN